MKEIVVVGSGIAGLIAALELSRKHHVTLVSKANLAESNTRWAQGGLAAVMFEDDTVAEHIADTLAAGAGLCKLLPVEILCSEGPERVRDLIRLGVEFDMQDGALARGLEAAHSHSRVLHAGGDATGLTIEMALVRAVRKADVNILEHTFARDLRVESGRVTGLEVLSPDGSGCTLPADAVILASGGAGQLYSHTTNPSVATGDGPAMAFRAGAELADVEFYQFHPTALALPGTFLISEAVRGEGAVLLDRSGHRFMQSIHRDAELAPRDVVARGIALQMAAQDGAPVLLDATSLGPAFLQQRFPSIDAACKARGLDWAHQPIPVTPAAHYWMGGIRTDVWGRTSLQGLFAVGEAACTGVHGANRLASNSLLESLVFAWRCAALLLDETGENALCEPPWTGERHLLETQQIDRKQVSRPELQTLMWNFAGIERNGAGLLATVKQLAGWESRGDSVETLETANLLTIAGVLVAGALARRESRGAHFRTDFPGTSLSLAHSLIFTQKAP